MLVWIVIALVILSCILAFAVYMNRQKHFENAIVTLSNSGLASRTALYRFDAQTGHNVHVVEGEYTILNVKKGFRVNLYKNVNVTNLAPAGMIKDTVELPASTDSYIGTGEDMEVAFYKGDVIRILRV